MKFREYIVKRRVENFFMYPFILLGQLLARLDPLRKEYNIFFFFPFYHTGGAEKVHALITKATGNKDCIIFFTRRSVDKTFLQEFISSGCEIKDISKYIDSNWLYPLKFIWRGKISAYINRQRNKPIVFNGQSNFGYKISPWINTGIKQVELIHSFNTFSWIRLPFLPFISETVMISKLRIEEHLEQYRKLNVPTHYDKKIHFIQNAIKLPLEECNKLASNNFKILFVGRGTPEKRPGLFVEISRVAQKSGLNITFTLAGEMDDRITSDLPSNTTAVGPVTDPAALHQLYCDHHILIIPSSTEGFPIVLMEAMARGCAVIATPVGDIPYHINDKNGFLFSSTEGSVVINESVDWLKQLSPEKLEHLSHSAKEYAFKNFGIESFNQQYKAILQP
jgi:L-malate glycosyltransferase